MTADYTPLPDFDKSFRIGSTSKSERNAATAEIVPLEHLLKAKRVDVLATVAPSEKLRGQINSLLKRSDSPEAVAACLA